MIFVERKGIRMGPSKHIITHGLAFCCLNCGDSYELTPGASVGVYSAAAYAYVDDHRHCQPSEQGRARMEYTNPAEWLRSWDTGRSSLTIYRFNTMLASGYVHDADIPYDAADLGRCLRLLAVAPPAWTDNLRDLAALLPKWKPYVDHWAELRAMYERGERSRLTARMRELRGDA